MTQGDTKTQFGTVVKKWRERLGISREELARRAGLRLTEIVEFEQGLRNLSLEWFNRIAIALELAAGIPFAN